MQLDNGIAMIDYIKCNLITHCISLITNSVAIILKCMAAKITSYVQSCLLKCFIVARLLLYSIPISNGLGCQYTLLLEAPQVDFLLQHTSKRHYAVIIQSGNIVMCWDALLRDAGSLT